MFMKVDFATAARPHDRHKFASVDFNAYAAQRVHPCLATRACPALPIATTQITAAIPMVIPRTVRMLRILFLSNATNADRKSAP
jgi:hypothetical protein